MHPALLAVAAFLLTPLGAVGSQVVGPRSGDRIRITAARKALHNRTARVLRVRGDSLILQVAPAETLAVALAGVTRLDVSTGRSRNALRGAGIGALIGVASGAVMGYASGDDDRGWYSLSAADKAVVYGAALGVPGVVIGLVVGSLTLSDRWISIPLRSAVATPSLQMDPSGRRVAVAVSFQPWRP